MKIENVCRWIGMVDGMEFFDTMSQIENHLKGERLPITLFINSEGGFLSIAFDFTEELRVRKIPINTIIIGRSDSAAVPISLFGEKRAITRKSHIFLHKLSFHKEEERRKCKNMADWYVSCLEEKTNLTKEQVLNMMDEEVLLNAEQALKYGFVHEII